jgi:hypothetical protein
MEFVNTIRVPQKIRARVGKGREVTPLGFTLPPATLAAPSKLAVPDDIVGAVMRANGPGARGLRSLVESGRVIASGPLPAAPKA